MCAPNVYEQAVQFQNFLNNSPNAKQYQQRDVELVKRDLANKLFSEHLMFKLKNNVEYLRPLTYENKNNTTTQLYEFVYFYPALKFYHDLKGFDGIDLYGKKLTDELLETWYTYALAYTLNSLTINVKYNDYSSPVTAQYLVEYLDTMVFRHIKGRFPNDMFKSLTYKAATLHAMKIAFLSADYDHDYDKACIELIEISLAECKDLSIEDFGLDVDTLKFIQEGCSKGKNEFSFANSFTLINAEMLNKFEMLIPDSSYNRHLTPEFLTIDSKFADKLSPKGSFKQYKESFFKFLANIG